jgi:hypothetical protein
VEFDRIALEWEVTPTLAVFEAAYHVAGVTLAVRSDDRGALDELTILLGPPDRPSTHSDASVPLRAIIRAHGGPPEFGYLRCEVDGAADVSSPDDFVLAQESRDFPFRVLQSGSHAWTAVAFRGETTPTFVLREGRCLFRLTQEWRTVVTLLLYHRLMRARSDAIFFHASSVGIDGRGVIFVGPRASGKSTTALALAARGHAFLGDNTACYLPATGEILPFRRAVGVRPGPRAQAVTQALARAGRDPERDGWLRLDADALVGSAEPPPTPLSAVVFLAGFAPEPRLVRVEPSREEVAMLQPIVGSLVNAAPTRRVFEMALLLSRVQVYRLTPGDPDATAMLLEEAFRHP